MDFGGRGHKSCYDQEVNRMTIKKPFFSILLPTRNRSSMLVNYALKSVLRSSFEDYEVVVCDNASQDDTWDRLREIKDPRIRYVKSTTWIPKEKFFEFSFRQARGEYSLIFCDDDYMTLDGLKKAYDILSEFYTDMLVFFPGCTYHYPDWYEPSRKDTLTIPCFDRKLLRIDSSSHLQAMYERVGLMWETPMVTDVFYKTSFINSLLDRFGGIFWHGHMGDYNISVYTLAHTTNYLYLNEPIVVFGHWEQNTTEQLFFMKTTMPEYKEWVSWMTRRYLAKMPVKTYQWKNCVAACLLDMKKRLNLPWEINLINYIYLLVEELLYMEVRGVDVSTQKEECLRFFESLSPDIKGTILEAIETGINLKDHYKYEVLKEVTGNETDKNHNPIIGSSEIRIKGSDYNFSNIFQAGDFYDKLLRKQVELNKHKDNDTCDHSGYTLNDYMKGVSIVKNLYKKICLVAGITYLSKITAEELNSKCACIIDLNPLLKGIEVVNGKRVAAFDTLLKEDFDCIIITRGDKYFGEDAPFRHLSDFIAAKLKDRGNNNVKIFTLEDLLKIGALVKELENKGLDLSVLWKGFIYEGERLVEKGEYDTALDIFKNLLNVCRKVYNIVLNDIAVVYAYKGNLHEAKKILNQMNTEDCDIEEIKTNIRVIERMLMN